MASTAHDETRERLLETFDMFEFGVDIMFCNLRRRYPNATAAEIEERLEAWLCERPGAERGDAEDPHRDR